METRSNITEYASLTKVRVSSSTSSFFWCLDTLTSLSVFILSAISFPPPFLHPPPRFPFLSPHPILLPSTPPSFSFAHFPPLILSPSLLAPPSPPFSGGFFIARRVTFQSLQNLVSHYTRDADGLCVNLRKACSRVETPQTVGLSYNTSGTSQGGVG